MTRHFLEIDDLSPAEVTEVLDLAEGSEPQPVLAGKGVALLFEKPSLRTRNSAEVAVFQLGGHPVTMQGSEVGLGTREPIPDVGRVLSRYHAAICARVFEHDKVVELARAASVPVINLLSDDTHPCQALADLLTIRQQFGKVEGIEVAYIGDYNNVARSLSVGVTALGGSIRIASPPGYGPREEDIDRLRLLGASPLVVNRAEVAADGADVIYTDVWASMGQEVEALARRRAFEGFTITDAFMAAASSRAVFLHCLPAHRGEEVAGEVVDGAHSLVWQQAENRLHAMRGLFLWLFRDGR